MSTELSDNKPTFHQQASYWRQRLSGELPVLELPLDHPRPPVSSFVRERQRIVIGEEVYQKLRTFCAQHNISSFVVLLAALNVLLLRYTEEKDIIIGFVLDGFRCLNSIEGKKNEWLSNPVALRTDLSGDPMASEVLSQVADTVREAVINGQYPFQAVLEDVERNGVNRPLPFRVMFDMEELIEESLTDRRFAVETHLSQELHVQCDFNLNIFTKRQFVVQVEYDAELFESATMSRMLGHYQNFLESMVTGSGKRLSDLTFLTDAEHHQLLVEWNQTSTNYPRDKCIYELLETQVKRTPEAVAVVFGDCQVTYRELNCRANRLAHHLHKLGVGPEDRVGVCMERGVDLMVSLLAILKAGGAYVPLDPSYPKERLAYMLANSRTSILLTQAAIGRQLPAYTGQMITLDWETFESESSDDLLCSTVPENLAYVLYTSGSTGHPKGVMITHENVVAFLHWARSVFSPENLEGVLAATSICFDLSVLELFVPLSWGGTVILAENALQLPELPALDRLTLINTVPSAIEAVLDKIVPQALQIVNLADEPLKTSLVEAIYSRWGVEKVHDLYGPSEATTYATYAVRFTNEPATIGRPLTNTTVYLLDQAGQLVPVGMPGELYIGGRQVARGYLDRPGLTAEKFMPHPFSREPGARMYRTGDQGRYRTDGAIEFRGRNDGQIKLRGYRIELGEIEGVLNQHPAVQNAVVLCREDMPGDKQLVAYLVPIPITTLEPLILRQYLQTRLPDYMIPGTFVMLDTFPLTPNGKVDRKALPQPVWKQRGLPEFLAIPPTHTERRLAEIWCQLLGLEEVSIHDHFFYLGGHSLLAMRLTSQIQHEFGVNLPISQIFEAPTLEELAKRIEALPVDSGPFPLPALSERMSQTAPPASYAQERMWFLQQSTPTSAVYNQSFLLRVQGNLQVEALQCSLQALEERHEPLRTTFALAVDRVEQHVQPASEFPLTLEDLSPLPPVEREARLWSLAFQEASRLFDLSRGPLWRSRLVRLGDTEHVLLLTFHHICMDEWSLRTFRRELSKLYAGLAAERVVKLTPLPCRYIDYAQWQRQWMESKVADNQLEYWRTKLGSELSALNLLTDYPRLSAPNVRGATERRLLSPSLLKRLKKLSSENEMTLFMTLLGAFQVLLYRYTGQDDVVVGTPIANRDSSKFQGLVGLFLNTIVMRCDLSGQPTVREMLLRVRKMALEAFAHRDVPFDMVVQALRRLREGNATPLFQVMFVLQNLKASAMPVGFLETTLSTVSTGTAKFELTLFLEAESEGLQAVMEYRTDLFEPTTIQQMLKNLEMLLEGIVTDPERRIGELLLLAESERHQALVEWNQTTANYPDGCIHQLVEEQAARTPEAVAMVFEDCHVTYRELNNRANRLAHHLQKLGVGPEVRVGLCVERSVAMVIGLLGILKAGGVYVPFNLEYPKERLAFMLQDVEPTVVLTNQELANLLKLYPFQTVPLNETLSGSTEVPNLSCQTSPDTLAYLLFTSGSTGQPKAVAVRHRTLINLVTWQATQSVCGAGDRTLQFSSLNFDVSLQEIFTTLCGGGTLVLIDEKTRRNLPALVQLIFSQRVAKVFSPFVMLEDLIQALLVSDTSPVCLRKFVAAGEQLHITPSMVNFFEKMDNTILVNQYGPTEAHVVSEYILGGPPARWMLHPPIGRPIWNMQLYILDEKLNPVPIGVRGELYIGGDGLARGYWKRPELTAEKFVPHPIGIQLGAQLYKTGDWARYRANGNIEFLGRRDHQVKIRGYRIELGEIETTLMQQKSVRQAIVLAREDLSSDKRLIAYIIPAKDKSPTTGELMKALAATLPDYMIPSIYVRLDAFPLTSNGKVSRRALPPPEPVPRAQDISYVPPRTLLEERLMEIWRDLLKVDQIGVHDNFFELGGHSLLATQVVGRAQALLQTEVPVRTLFDCPTIAQFVATLDKAWLHSSAIALHPKEHEGPRLLSFAQQRLWFLEQWEPGNSVYLLPYAWQLRGPLDSAVLEASLTALAARHESLRTICAIVDEQPVQVITPATPVSLPLRDLTGLPETRREDEVQRLIHQETHQPFDLPTGPLWRAQLLRLGPEEHVLLLTLHHIITDGWSMRIVFQELGTLYTAQVTGQLATLPPLPLQYGDFAIWQREWLQGDVLDQQLTYWRTQLAEVAPSLGLFTDFQRPPQLSHRGDRISFTLPSLLTQTLKTLSQQEGVTLFMTLLAAFQILLGRYTGQRDILVGTPIAGRTHPDLEGLIGFFVNTLVLRTQFKGQPTFRAVLQQVRDTCLDAYAHQDLAFEKLVEALQPVRDPSRHPLFQVMFQLHHGDSTGELTLPKLEVVPLAPVIQTAKFDLSLGLVMGGETLQGTITFNADLFEPATIKRLATHYHTLLEGVVAHPTQAVSHIPLMTDAERHQLLVKWNPPVSRMPPTLPAHHLFEAQAARTPEAVAVVYEDEQLTYGTLNERAHQLAKYLSRQGVGPEVRVGLYMERSVTMVTGLWGILKTGGAYVPLDPSTPDDRMRVMFTEAHVDLVLTQLSLLKRFQNQRPLTNSESQHHPQWVAIDDSDFGIQACDSSDLRPIVSPDNLAYVIYTSGSTGQPKGVAITQANLTQFILAASSYLEIQPSDRVLHFASLALDTAVEEIFPCLIRGGTLVLRTEAMIDTVSTFLDAVKSFQLTLLDLPTAYWHELTAALSVKPFSLPDSIRLVVIGGEQARADQLAIWRQHIPDSQNLLNTYGPTEATVVAAREHLSRTSIQDGHRPISPVSIGRPLENRSIYILDAFLQPMPIGVPGELYLGGQGLGRGYDHLQKLTAEAFVPDPFSPHHGARLYRTGDRGRYRANGTIELLGRMDQQIKIRGYRVELEEIESCLRQIPEIQDAVVLAQSSDQTHTSLVAYVVSHRHFPLSTTSIRQVLQGKLPDFMIPARIIHLEELPRLPSGKINRKALFSASLTSFGKDTVGRCPETAVEETLVSTWKELLHLPTVNVRDNFFELGGHSLLATRLLARLREIWQNDFPLRILFDHPILEDQALVIEEYLLKEIEKLSEEDLHNLLKDQGPT